MSNLNHANCYFFEMVSLDNHVILFLITNIFNFFKNIALNESFSTEDA